MAKGSATPITPQIDNHRSDARAKSIFHRQYNRVLQRTDHLLAWLMIGQWVAAVGLAWFLSPYAWAGKVHVIHAHVFAALLLGGVISALPVALAWLRPGRTSTRWAIACGQMLWSALLIHLTGGRIETHFHVFGSLAILAFYRDLKVLIPATVVVAADHFVRGIYWPESVYGVANPEWWRFLEHAGWVVFIDVFLIKNCKQAYDELWELSRRQAELENHQELLEERIEQRTQELKVANRQLVDASREVGKAEVVTGILHNVGNVLTSVNISAQLMLDQLAKSRVSTLSKTTELLDLHQHDLGTFLTEDPKGRLLPSMLRTLRDHLRDEQTALIGEAELLQENIAHIKTIIVTQQANASVAGIQEVIAPSEVIDSASQLCELSFKRHRIYLKRESEPIPPIPIDRHRVLLILINLLKNAKQAVNESGKGDRTITVSLKKNGKDSVQILVRDHGIGIASGP